MEKTIELDCAPMTPRPDTYIKAVIEGTPLAGKLREPVSKLFGNWTWDFSHVSDEDFQKARPILKERIIRLHNNGFIRYGSW